MTLGKEGIEQARVHDLLTGSALLDAFESHGHSEIDTASSYGEGSSEKMLGQLNLSARNLRIATKYYPTFNRAVPASWDQNLRHTPTGLRENLKASLKALNTDKLDMWYLHAPDRSTPFSETFEAVNALHQEGLFTASPIRTHPPQKKKDSKHIQPRVYIIQTARLVTAPLLSPY